jgi:hypothetical protein
MTTPFPFVSGAVLTAQQLNDITNLPINDQTASYVLVVGDAGKRVIMNNASATTITVNNSVFTTGDTIFIANKGAGTTTITAGAGVTINPAGSLAVTQYGGGTLVALSASTFQFFPIGGVKVLSTDLFLVSGGGGGGGIGGTRGGGGGGGGGVNTVTGAPLIAGTYTITVGAGGTGGVQDSGYPGGATYFGGYGSIGGGGGGGEENTAGSIGGSGGGGGRTSGAGGLGFSGQGNNGGTGSGDTGAGGGGGAASVGSNGAANTGGNGGTATTNNWTGTTYSVGGGGGGAGTTTAGTGGTNAGTGGNTATPTPTAGAANGGGGGGGRWTLGNGAAGGSGVVIIRFLTSDATKFSISTTGSPTTGTNGSYTWYRWTSSGSLVLA